MKFVANFFKSYIQVYLVINVTVNGFVVLMDMRVSQNVILVYYIHVFTYRTNVINISKNAKKDFENFRVYYLSWGPHLK